MSLHPAVERVTARIRDRSAPARAAYLARIDAARDAGPARARLSCGNLAHGFAASGGDKPLLRAQVAPNLGIITAVKGATLIKSIGLEKMPIPLMIALILFSATVNLIIGSASAKWALLAPIFVPMFMLLGYTPELVQAAYRVGDSCTNIITPLMAYFPLILTFARRYEKEAGIGTMIASMLPYSISFLIFWTLLLVVWITLGLPVGINAPLYLPGR